MKDPFSKLYSVIMQEYSWNQPNMDKPFIQKWEDDEWEDRSEQSQYQDWDEKDIKPEPTLKQRARKDRKTGLYNIFGDVRIKEEDLVDGHLPFPLGTISGDLKLECLKGLTSLINCPQKVTGNLWIGYDHNLTSLEGCPKEVGKRFRIQYMDKITTLIGSPDHIGKSYECCNLSGIKSMIGVTQNIDGDLDISECWNLTSLEGCPETVNGNFILFTAPELTTLKGGPRVVKGNCRTTRCYALTNLQGAPQEIGGDYCCHLCKHLQTLKGLNIIKGNLDCSYCQNLVDLHGPRRIGKDIIYRCIPFKGKYDRIDNWPVYGQFKIEQIL